MNHRRLLLSLALCLTVLVGCGGTTSVQRPELPRELRAEISSTSVPLSLQDDYWTERLGAYLSPEDLHVYWIMPPERRFAGYGKRWLEFCLREDLLAERRWPLGSEDLEQFRSQPDFDSSRRLLEQTPETQSE